MLRFEDLALRRGPLLLFEHVDLALHAGWRIGVSGRNGAGKSSLLGLVAGELAPDAGHFERPRDWAMAFVRQEVAALDIAAVEYVLDGDPELRQIERALAIAEDAHDAARIAALHDRLHAIGGYSARARAGELLHGLGFKSSDEARAVREFSGGWRMRLNLAQALMCRSDLLLLDEPTNHLDLDAIVWLEDWLHRYPGTLVVISHDREFLDSICNVTLHLENRQVKRYGGNYSQFEVLRAQQLALQQSAYEKQQKTIEHLQSFVDRFKAKATKAKQAQSRMKALEKMELIAPAHIASPFTFEFRTPDAAPNPMMVMEDVRCGYHADDGADIPIVERVALSIQNGQRIGLLGANGQGKSTLIKTLAGTLAPLSGDVREGKGLTIGYFAQHQLETLREDDSPLAHLARLAPDTREQELRDFLGGFNFSGEMATSPVGPFSGGEKARLALALIIWQKPNLLLLDEPTNHLDLETRHALTMALAQFEGTLILVSHDRHLLRATTDQFMLVAKHRLQPFDGDLDDYRDWLLQHAAEQRAAAKADGAAATGADPGVNRKDQKRQAAEERQRLSQLKKPLQNRITKLEKEMETLHAEKARLDAFVADPASYEAARKTELTDAIRKLGEVNSRLETVEADWLAVHEELEQIG